VRLDLVNPAWSITLSRVHYHRGNKDHLPHGSLRPVGLIAEMAAAKVSGQGAAGLSELKALGAGRKLMADELHLDVALVDQGPLGRLPGPWLQSGLGLFHQVGISGV